MHMHAKPQSAAAVLHVQRARTAPLCAVRSRGAGQLALGRGHHAAHAVAARVDTHDMICARAHANPKSRPHLSRAGQFAGRALARHARRAHCTVTLAVRVPALPVPRTKRKLPWGGFTTPHAYQALGRTKPWAYRVPPCGACTHRWRPTRRGLRCCKSTRHACAPTSR